MVKTVRHGGSLAELIVAFIVLGAVMAPGIGAMRRQVADTRWSNERMMAMQLANELLDYHKHLGYQGLRLALTNHVSPMSVPLPLDGQPNNGFLVFDGWVGDGTKQIYPQGKNAPNGVNPSLGGPGDIQRGLWFTAPDNVAPMPAGAVNVSGTELSLRSHFKLRRRVEIFGGDAATQPPPPNHFQPFPGMSRPLDCYKIRVTIETRSVGTMVRPEDKYQVVTVLARH